ncbi:hypothetical protein A3Q56_05646 [Intoshia linei]|uniref:HTH CENPB-type domain-containing protein n=1 Tax=Intoshia linei TaxID=1819745 RepID=A0A177AX74_9BILA|nr:hypothetical protein A3Q56_05646 [Intoshia linei]
MISKLSNLRNINIPVSGYVIKEQAKILKKEMNSENCGGLKKLKASDGWMDD